MTNTYHVMCSACDYYRTFTRMADASAAMFNHGIANMDHGMLCWDESPTPARELPKMPCYCDSAYHPEGH